MPITISNRANSEVQTVNLKFFFFEERSVKYRLVATEKIGCKLN